MQADGRRLARYADYEARLNALATAHGAHNVGNVAAALGLIIKVFERHLCELRDGVWFDPDSGEAIGAAGRLVPIEIVLETRSMQADAAAVLARAVYTLVRSGEVPADQRPPGTPTRHSTTRRLSSSPSPPAPGNQPSGEPGQPHRRSASTPSQTEDRFAYRYF